MYANISVHKGQVSFWRAVCLRSLFTDNDKGSCGILQLPSEFNIQSEEFPALPGQQTHRSDDRTSAPETSQVPWAISGNLLMSVASIRLFMMTCTNAAASDEWPEPWRGRAAGASSGGTSNIRCRRFSSQKQ